MGPWSKLIALSVGGILGVNARYWIGYWMDHWAGSRFPWATFTINISGAFAIGFLAVALVRWLPHPNVQLLVVTGFLGGFTTFSTLALESALLWERGDAGLSLANLVGSIAIGLLAVMLGLGLGRAIVAPDQDSEGTSSPPAVELHQQDETTLASGFGPSRF